MSTEQIAEARIGHYKLILWSRWSGAAGGWLLKHIAKPGPLGRIYKAPPCWYPLEPRPEYPTDQEALEIDRLVSSLPSKHRHAIAARYLLRCRPDPMVLKAIGVSRASWYRILDHAKYLIGVENRRKQLYG